MITATSPLTASRERPGASTSSARCGRCHDPNWAGARVVKIFLYLTFWTNLACVSLDVQKNDLDDKKQQSLTFNMVGQILKTDQDLLIYGESPERQYGGRNSRRKQLLRISDSSMTSCKLTLPYMEATKGSDE